MNLQMLTGKAIALKAFALVNWVPIQEVAGFTWDEPCRAARPCSAPAPAFYKRYGRQPTMKPMPAQVSLIKEVSSGW